MRKRKEGASGVTAVLSFLAVGLGGAVGAMLRYGIGLIPVSARFPILTLCINFLGAVAIGLISECALAGQCTSRCVLFWKTGVCGGFTTFSTFSLEAAALFQQKAWGMGSLYVILSIMLCLGGVFLGRMLHHYVWR